MMKFSKFIITSILIFFLQNISVAQLKKVTTIDEYCRIYKILESNEITDQYETIKQLGYDPNSFIEFGFKNPSILGGCDNQLNLEISDNKNYILCDSEWRYTKLKNPNLNKGWIKVTIDEIKIINKNSGEALVYFTMENTTALFFQLERSNLYIAQNGDGPNPPTDFDFLLFPKEKKQYYKPLRLITDCSKDKKDGKYKLELKFSRGEISSINYNVKLKDSTINLNDFLSKIAELYFFPAAFSKTLIDLNFNINFSNKAAYLNILNILWTAATGDWLTRDFFDISISGLSGILDFGLSENCDKIQFLLNLSPDIISSLYNEKIDPFTFLSAFFTTYGCLLNNKLTQKYAFEIIQKILPGLAKDGVEKVAKNFGYIVAGYWRVFSLAPISYDAVKTLELEDYIALDIILKCCPSNY